MNRVEAYLRAFARPYSFDARRNPYVLFGLLWGLPVPIFSILLDLTLSGVGGRSPLDAVRDHPIHLVFLAHPFFFAAVFGAMGTVRHELEEENRRLIGRLAAEAASDPLTGLLNRRMGLQELESAIHRTRRTGERLSLVLFDLDHFKEVNEKGGHLEGDRVLRGVAEAMRSVVRQGETLARYGGDEFLIVIPGNHGSALSVAERVRESVLLQTGLDVSAGTAMRPGDGETGEDLLLRADERLAADKKRHHETESLAR